jgi:hypothetical protein
MKQRRKVYSIDEVEDAGARKVLRAVLTSFAKMVKRPNDLSEQEMVAGTIELFEHGYLQIIVDDKVCKVLPCLPADAPQLNRPRALERFAADRMAPREADR